MPVDANSDKYEERKSELTLLYTRIKYKILRIHRTFINVVQLTSMN